VGDLVTGPDQYGGRALERTQEYRPLASGELADTWDLGDFFEALGPVMRLPPKDSDEAPAKPRAAANPRRTSLLVALAVMLVLGAGAAGPLWRALHPSIPVPEGLIGTWSTTVGRYAGRSFELSPTTLHLDLGGQSAVYPIAEVRSREIEKTVVYIIRYRHEQDVLELGLMVDADSAVRLRNLPEVDWRKAQPR
jgi:hypothetical protein